MAENASQIVESDTFVNSNMAENYFESAPVYKKILIEKKARETNNDFEKSMTKVLQDFETEPMMDENTK